MKLKFAKDQYTLELNTVLENKPGHLYTITFTDISKNNIIATGSWDGTVRLHSESSELEVIFFFKEPVEGLRFSPNGKFLAVGIENEIHVYDMTTKKTFRIFPKETALRGAVFTWSDDSTKLVCIFYDMSIRVLDINTQQEIGLINDCPTLGGNIIAWKQDILAVGLNNSQIALYNLNSAVFQFVGFLEGHTDIVNAVTFSDVEDDMNLYSVSSDKTILCWDLKNKSRKRVIHSHDSSLLYVTVKHTLSGQQLLACSETDNILFLEEQLQGVVSLQEGSYCNASMNASADKFVRGINDHDLGIFSIFEKKLLSVLEGKSDQVNTVNMISNEEIIYASNDKTIHLVNLNTKEEFKFKGHSEAISSISLSKNKKTVVSSSYDDTIRLWDIQTRREIKIVTKNAELPSAVLMSDNDTIISASGGDFSIKGLTIDGKTLFSENIHEEYVNKLIAYKNDFFSGGDDKKVVFWNNNNKKGKILAKGDSEITSIAISTNNNLIAFGTIKGTLTILEIKSSQKKAEIKFPRKISSCAFSPDDKFIAIGTHTNLFIHYFETGENFPICSFFEPVKEIFWFPPNKPTSAGFKSQIIAISISREVLAGTVFETMASEKEVSKIDKLKLLTETQVIKGSEKPEQKEFPREEKESTIETSVHIADPKIELPVQTSEPAIEQLGLLEKFQEEVENMVSPEKSSQIISDFSTSLTKNMSSFELGSLVYKEYMETLKHLDKIQELIQINSDDSHIGFRIIYNRINRLKPVINEAVEEIDFILD